jgi:Tfp pilus assembly protein PilN
MRIRLNVATRPLEGHRRFLVEAAAAGVLGLLALLVLSTGVYRTWRQNRGERAEIARYDSQLRQLRSERGQLAAFFQAPNTRTVMDRAAFLNSLIDQRSFPWTKIFTDLEKVLPAGVRVVSIAPEMKDGQVDVKLEIGAVSDKSKIAFLEALQSSNAFSEVRVNAERRANQTGGPDVVNLQLEALYSGAAAVK